MKGNDRGKFGGPRADVKASRFVGMGGTNAPKTNATPERPVDGRLAPPSKLKAGASMRLAGFAAKKRA